MENGAAGILVEDADSLAVRHVHFLIRVVVGHGPARGRFGGE
jgi:hypothetical protein